VFGKGLSLLSQFALAWILSKEEFGEYAIAIAIATAFQALRHGGTQSILIQKGNDYPSAISAVSKVAALFNLACAVLMFIAGVLFSQVYDSPTLVWLLGICSISVIVHMPVAISRPVVSVHLQYRAISRIDLVSMGIRHIGMVLLALAGAGIYSFFLPLIFLSVYESIAFQKIMRSCANPLPANQEIVGFREVLAESRWLIIASFGVAMISSAPNMIIGFFETRSNTGVFFFAFMMATNIYALIDSNLRIVVMPVMSHLASHEERQVFALRKAMRLICLVSSFLASTIAILSPFIVSVLWSGKWDDSIIFLQAFLFMLPFLSIAGVIYNYLASVAKWRLRAKLLMLEAIFLAIVVTYGCMVSDLISVAIFIACTRAVYAMFLIGIVFYPRKELKIYMNYFARLVLVPIFPAIVLAAISSISIEQASYIVYVGCLFLHACMLILGAAYIYKDEVVEIRRIVLKAVPRNPVLRN
jgi:O-antigen/teichoic acid export membrane protein